jgi:hypothetical protein
MLPMPTEIRVVDTIDDTAYKRLDKRGTQPPVPDEIDMYLTDLQRISLSQLGDFGWHLAFVRRPLFESPTVVLLSPEEKQYAILEEEGSLDLDPQIRLRLN